MDSISAQQPLHAREIPCYLELDGKTFRMVVVNKSSAEASGSPSQMGSKDQVLSLPQLESPFLFVSRSPKVSETQVMPLPQVLWKPEIESSARVRTQPQIIHRSQNGNVASLVFLPQMVFQPQMVSEPNAQMMVTQLPAQPKSQATSKSELESNAQHASQSVESRIQTISQSHIDSKTGVLSQLESRMSLQPLSVTKHFAATHDTEMVPSFQAESKHTLLLKPQMALEAEKETRSRAVRDVQMVESMPSFELPPQRVPVSRSECSFESLNSVRRGTTEGCQTANSLETFEDALGDFNPGSVTTLDLESAWETILDLSPESESKIDLDPDWVSTLNFNSITEAADDFEREFDPTFFLTLLDLPESSLHVTPALETVHNLKRGPEATKNITPGSEIASHCGGHDTKITRNSVSVLRSNAKQATFAQPTQPSKNSLELSHNLNQVADPKVDLQVCSIVNQNCDPDDIPIAPLSFREDSSLSQDRLRLDLGSEAAPYLSDRPDTTPRLNDLSSRAVNTNPDSCLTSDSSLRLSSCSNATLDLGPSLESIKDSAVAFELSDVSEEPLLDLVDVSDSTSLNLRSLDENKSTDANYVSDDVNELEHVLDIALELRLASDKANGLNEPLNAVPDIRDVSDIALELSRILDTVLQLNHVPNPVPELSEATGSALQLDNVPELSRASDTNQCVDPPLELSVVSNAVLELSHISNNAFDDRDSDMGLDLECDSASNLCKSSLSSGMRAPRQSFESFRVSIDSDALDDSSNDSDVALKSNHDSDTMRTLSPSPTSIVESAPFELNPDSDAIEELSRGFTKVLHLNQDSNTINYLNLDSSTPIDIEEKMKPTIDINQDLTTVSDVNYDLDIAVERPECQCPENDVDEGLDLDSVVHVNRDLDTAIIITQGLPSEVDLGHDFELDVSHDSSAALHVNPTEDLESSVPVVSTDPRSDGTSLSFEFSHASRDSDRNVDFSSTFSTSDTGPLSITGRNTPDESPECIIPSDDPDGNSDCIVANRVADESPDGNNTRTGPDHSPDCINASGSPDSIGGSGSFDGSPDSFVGSFGPNESSDFSHSSSNSQAPDSSNASSDLAKCSDSETVFVPGDELVLVKVEPEDFAIGSRQRINVAVTVHDNGTFIIKPCPVSTDVDLPAFSGEYSGLLDGGSSDPKVSMETHKMDVRTSGSAVGSDRTSTNTSSSLNERRSPNLSLQKSLIIPSLEKRKKPKSVGQFECETCHKSFDTARKVKRHHLRIHVLQKNHICSDCGKKFANPCDLDRHWRTHTGEKPFKCDQCGKSFSQLTHVLDHSKVHLKRVFPCPQCGESFVGSRELANHVRCHMTKKPCVCNECGKTFSNPHNLARHYGTHTGAKPHNCDTCGKQFSLIQDLTRHVRTHTGERPYHCRMCGMAFSRPGTLRQHIRLHSGEKPFHCDVCQKNFARSSHLKLHLKVHSNSGGTGSKGNPISVALC